MEKSDEQNIGLTCSKSGYDCVINSVLSKNYKTRCSGGIRVGSIEGNAGQEVRSKFPGVGRAKGEGKDDT